MPPRLTFTLTLLGVLLAGAPLLVLTGKGPAAPQTAEVATEQETCSVMAEVRFDGAPRGLHLLYQGKEVAAMPQGTESPWLEEIRIPQDAAELELQAEWPAAAQHAVNITLTRGAATAQDTQWSSPAATTLHTLFSFTW